jgi:uncharacterized protein
MEDAGDQQPSDAPPAAADGTSAAAGGVAHAAADGVWHRLDPRWVSYQRRVGLVDAAITAVVLLGLAGAGALLADLPGLPLVAVALLTATLRVAVSQWWPGLAYRYASYRLDTRTLEIRRGVLWRSIIDVPRTRIQHSDVSQGPVERMHGLGTLTIHTAGTRHAQVQLRGLEHGRALAIREHLMHADDDDVV